MSYLANSTRVALLSVGGADYTSALVELTVSDSSANRNGCIVTTGTLSLGSYTGGPLVEDYDRDNFKRGTVVLLDLVGSDGTTYRHPRGYLYVISTSYKVEDEMLEVSLGCRLSLMNLTDEIDELLSIVPIPLDRAQETFSNCSASFSSASQYVYQDNQGVLQTGRFFENDKYDQAAAGEWVSLLGITALSASPLAGTSPIPDSIKLSYQVPEGDKASDQRGTTSSVSVISRYFLQYPATIYERKDSNNTQNLSSVSGVSASPSRTRASSKSCGEPERVPESNEDDSCNEGYELVAAPYFAAATRYESQVTHYDGPAAQVSAVYQTITGPALEANPQYYSDLFSNCRSSWGTACRPNGNGCVAEGMVNTTLRETTTHNSYGPGGELATSIVTNYEPKLAAAQPFDWRSGIVDGIPQDFQRIDPSPMYRQSVVTSKYYKEGNTNVQITTTETSSASRGGGLRGSIDAKSGIKTSTERRSTSQATVDITPDLLNTPSTSTKEQSTDVVLFAGRYSLNPEEAGPYILEEQIPIPLLFDTSAEIETTVEDYSTYIEKFVKGDSFGMQIAEAMRPEIFNNWRPGMPFRYYDSSKDKLLAMRMDATVWGVTQDETALTTDGMFIGYSDGTVTVPQNLVGNSLPDMSGTGGGGTTPPPATRPPAIDDETSIDSGSFAWIVNVHLNFTTEVQDWGFDGIVPVLPADLNYNIHRTTTCFVAGAVWSAGSLLATDAGGSVPLGSGGTLVTVNAILVDSDLF